MYLYLVKMNSTSSGEYFYKVGITKHSDILQRFSYGETKVIDSELDFREKVEQLLEGQKYISDHPYEIEKIHSVKYSLDGDAEIAEDLLLNELKKYQYWPKEEFSGKSECFLGDDLRDFIVKLMDQDSNARNKEAPSELRYKLEGMMVKEQNPKKRHALILERCKKSS